MRIAAAALALTAALASGPASAAETCPMQRAIYTLKDAPDYQLEFRFDTEMAEVARTASPTIYYDVVATMRHRSGLDIAEFMFYSPSSSGSKTQTAAVTSSRYIVEKREGLPTMTFPTAFPLIGLTKDFSTDGVRYSDSAAPPALIVPGVAHALTFATAFADPDHEVVNRMPEGAWVLSGCR
ncbi:hypothetical protein [Parvibaculum sp.]|uniref:hypothetical protein n=1 Tax=Parvibaculum sp. TaxID=2024848 RepID=UPI002637CE84|nr:hypothetical protein [Parvibaculum sp.]MCW5728161.1 hypothetical protein [Parvibaculum sp.]